ncbi:MAG: CSLREA domain-containing protein, partial [Oscillochloris sp.]|nr:CSLREA domain-containing protein [Oscillochloris sp.]
MSERRNWWYILVAFALLLAPFALMVKPAQAAGTYVVTSTADTGGTCDSTPTTCTLRQAILSSNSDGVSSKINFNFTGSGNITITPSSALPVLTSTDTTITGLMNAAFQPRIIINGAGSLPYGISISSTADRTTIENLIFTGFRGQGSVPFGVAIYVNGADGVVVHGSYIGNIPGTTYDSSQANRIGILVSGGSGTTIGGIQDTYRNTISGNTSDGVVISTAANTTVVNNYIGVALDSLTSSATPVANGGNGIQVESSTGVTVGGSPINIIS